MNRKVWLSFVLCGVIFGFFSCQEKDVFDSYEQWNKDVSAIDNYLAENSIDAVKDSRGVRMVVTEVGTGLTSGIFNKVDVDYTGKLFSTGAVFDDGNTQEFLTQYIEGWQIAMTTLPAGSRATVYIPSALGYGNVQQGSIPPNSVLVFDLHFKGIVRSTSEVSLFTSDTTAIDTYLANKNISAVTDTSGVRYVINNQGSTDAPGLYDKLKITYTIKELANDGTTVATVDGEPTDNYDSRMVDYIPGMVAGLQKIGTGGDITLYIPSGLAFGAPGVVTNGSRLIQTNSNLIINIKLNEIL
jgi:FKBP-type peptidyl-prolyl cis-trans isomerase